MNVLQYRQEQTKELAKARSIHDLAEKEGRDMTEQETVQFNDHISNAEKNGAKAEQLDKLETFESSMKESAGRISKPEPIHNEIQRYSVMRAMRSMLEKGRLDGVEAEVSDEIAKKTGKAPQGFYLPHDLRVERYGNLDTTTGAGALNSVVDYSNFIELLRNKMLVNTLGARVLGDLTGATVQIPKQTGAGSAYWINADGSSTITASNQTIGQVPLSPSTVGAQTSYTRAFLKQTGLDVEQFTLDDLATVIALEMDRVVFNGSGSGAVPEGILQNNSVTTVALGTNGDHPTLAKLIEMETNVAVGNADLGNLAYVTTPGTRGYLKGTQVASNTPRMIWENNQVNGYSAFATNQLPANLTKGGYGTGLSAIIFGNFLDVLIGMWGGTDVVINPYSGDTAGSVRITLMQDCDIALRHVESFCKIVDAVTV